MDTRSYTFAFPKFCDQQIMLNMVIMLLSVKMFDVSAYSGQYHLPEEEFTAFSQSHPDFLPEYIKLMDFATLITMDHDVVLTNITVISTTGQAIITFNVTPKPLYTMVGLL